MKRKKWIRAERVTTTKASELRVPLLGVSMDFMYWS